MFLRPSIILFRTTIVFFFAVVISAAIFAVFVCAREGGRNIFLLVDFLMKNMWLQCLQYYIYDCNVMYGCNVKYVAANYIYGCNIIHIWLQFGYNVIYMAAMLCIWLQCYIYGCNVIYVEIYMVAILYMCLKYYNMAAMLYMAAILYIWLQFDYLPCPSTPNFVCSFSFSLLRGSLSRARPHVYVLVLVLSCSFSLARFLLLVFSCSFSFSF